MISAMDWYKAPSNYHWPSDRPENLEQENVWRAARLALAFARTLDEQASRPLDGGGSEDRARSVTEAGEK